MDYNFNWWHYFSKLSNKRVTMPNPDKREEIEIVSRIDFNYSLSSWDFIVDSKATGGSSNKNDGFFEGMMFGLIIGSGI